MISLSKRLQRERRVLHNWKVSPILRQIGVYVDRFTQSINMLKICTDHGQSVSRLGERGSLKNGDENEQRDSTYLFRLDASNQCSLVRHPCPTSSSAGG